MSLFTKNIDEITFEDVEQFVENWPEGVRVEYKKNIPSGKLPKSVASFANTLGGVLILGVNDDKQTQTRAIIGVDKRVNITEGIYDSSVNGIYPSIVPDVKVIELPTDSNKVVVVVKISESDLAPHAVQNSTEIYVRRENITESIELADLERIEFLLKRRKNSEKVRDNLIGKMLDHCKIDLEQARVSVKPLIQITVSPLYPYKPIIGKDQLYKFANEYRSERGIFFRHRSNTKRISDGVFNKLTDENCYVYNRLNDYGCLLSIQNIKEHAGDDSKNNLALYGILNPIWNCLELVSQLYEKCDLSYKGNLLINVLIRNVLNREVLLSSGWSSDQHPSHEEQISLSRQLISDELQNIHSIVKSIGKEILWAFQLASPGIDKIIDDNLRSNGFLPPLKS